MNRAQQIAALNRKAVDTPEGPFVIRSLKPMDYVKASAPMPRELQIRVGMSPKELEKAIRLIADDADRVLEFTARLIERATLDPKVVANPNDADLDANRIAFDELHQTTCDKLAQGINEFSGLVGEAPKSEQPARPADTRKEPSDN